MIKDGMQVLHHADPKEPFYLFVDSSQKYYGAVLLQKRSGHYVICDMYSKIWKAADYHKHITSKELLAMVDAFKTLQHWLLAGRFIVHSDSRNIKHLFKVTGYAEKEKKSVNQMHYKWVSLLSAYSFEVRFISGVKNLLADYYSRWIDKDQLKNWEEGDLSFG